MTDTELLAAFESCTLPFEQAEGTVAKRDASKSPALEKAGLVDIAEQRHEL
jgi:hypothetical protein